MNCFIKDNRSELRSYAYHLVSEKKVSFIHLNDDEKSVLTGLIIKNCDKISAHEYITESDCKDELPNMLAEYMISKNQSLLKTSDRANELLELMNNNANTYAAIRIDKLLEEINEQFESDRKFYNE